MRAIASLFAVAVLSLGLAACEEDDEVELETPEGEVEVETPD